MREPIQDNIYPLGTRVLAREDPTRQLIIAKYYQRIYYCAVADDPGHTHLPYYERELLPPDELTTKENDNIMRGYLDIIVVSLKEVIDNIYKLLLHTRVGQMSIACVDQDIIKSGGTGSN